MLKKIYCEARLKINISPVDAILIKSGSATVTGPDMTFVKTYRNGYANPFLPGSSLKGIFRSHSERIVRTISEKPSACVPYKQKDDENARFCGEFFDDYKKRTDQRPSQPDTYKYSCPICKTFGSTFFKGRCSVSDAYSDEKIIPEDRDGVAIDRYTGGAAHGAKFDLEVINKGNFGAEIHIRNFEIWQLGLVGFVIQDINDGIIRLGFGTSRGLGRIRLDIKEFELSYYGLSGDKLKDLGGCSTEQEKKDYGFYRHSSELVLPTGTETGGVRKVFTLSETEQKQIFKEGGRSLNEYLGNIDWLKNIRAFAGS